VPAPSATPGPKFLLLVGPADRELARAVAHRTHGQVQAWSRTDDGAQAWTADDVTAALADTTAEEVLVLSEAGRPHAIPIHHVLGRVPGRRRSRGE
jgi:hypothetical protein